MPRLTVWFLAAGSCVLPATALAQTSTVPAPRVPAPPWSHPDAAGNGSPAPAPPTPSSPIPMEPAPGWSGPWPVAVGTGVRRVPRAPSPAAVLASPDTVTEPWDPGAGHAFQMPTARVLRLGDVLGHYVSDLGWVGVRMGVARRVDVGVGVPYYFLGLSADARAALVQQPGFAVSWWAYLSVPFQVNGARATTNLGFTWAHAGMGWVSGPLVSVWGDRAAFHAGVHVAQRTGLGGLWLLSHATLEFRAVPGLKLLVQGVVLYELAAETGAHDSALVGNATPRFLPYVLGGVRFYTRRFAADFGLLAPLDARDPLYTARLPVLPWVSLAHLF